MNQMHANSIPHLDANRKNDRTAGRPAGEAVRVLSIHIRADASKFRRKKPKRLNFLLQAKTVFASCQASNSRRRWFGNQQRILRADGVADVLGRIIEFDHDQRARDVLFVTECFRLRDAFKFPGLLHVPVPGNAIEVPFPDRILNQNAHIVLSNGEAKGFPRRWQEKTAQKLRVLLRLEF
jgi:hypothetical protein